MIFSSWGACKHYHSDLVQRAEILLMALTGNQGKSGGGLRVASWWELDGQRALWGGGSGPAWMTASEKLGLLYKAKIGGGLSWREFEEPRGEVEGVPRQHPADVVPVRARRLQGNLGLARVPRPRPAATARRRT